MKRSRRKQVLIKRMGEVGLDWFATDDKDFGDYRILNGSRVELLRTLNEVDSYVTACEQAAKASTKIDGDNIICDFWTDLAA